MLGTIHSLHAYFLKGGAHDAPIRFVVERIRDGRTFSTRHVVAYQKGEAIFDLSASFTRPEEGIAHQGAMPEAPGPDGLPDFEELRGEILLDAERKRRSKAIEIRAVEPDEPGRQLPPHRRMWVRPVGSLPDDRLVRMPRSWSTPATAPCSARQRGPMASRSGSGCRPVWTHSVWFHGPVTFDDWLLYSTESPVARHARGMVFGSLWTREGQCVASVAQEGIIRVAREQPRAD